jgi:hypothetical protein
MDRRRATNSHEIADGVPASSDPYHERVLHSSSSARGLAAVSPSARAVAVHRWTTHSPRRSSKIITPLSLRIAQVCGHVPAQQHGPVCPSAARRRPHPCGRDPRSLSGLGSDALPQRRDVPAALLASPGANGRSSRSPASCPYRTKQLGLFIGTTADLGARKELGKERGFAGGLARRGRATLPPGRSGAAVRLLLGGIRDCQLRLDEVRSSRARDHG